jgi:hypothetical protein
MRCCCAAAGGSYTQSLFISQYDMAKAIASLSLIVFLLHITISIAFLPNSLLRTLPTRQKLTLKKMASFATQQGAGAPSRNPHNFSWQQTMLRIKDPKVSVPFYEKNFGFKLIHYYNFPQWSFSLYFLAVIPDDEQLNFEPGTPESEEYLWTMRHVCLELTHNHGSV